MLKLSSSELVVGARYWRDTIAAAAVAVWRDVVDKLGLGTLLVTWFALTAGWFLLTHVEGPFKSAAEGIWGGPVLALGASVILLIAAKTFLIPAREHVELEKAKQEIQRKRHNMNGAEPAVDNAGSVWAAFAQWRKDLGDEGPTYPLPPNAPPPLLLVSYGQHPSRFVMTFLSFAVKGSNIGNGNLHNLGVKAEDIEALERELSRDDNVFFTASSDARGAMKLFDSLSSKILHLTRRYTMPYAPKPYSPHTVWIHFGPNARWTSEYFEEQAGRAPRKLGQSPLGN